MLDNRVRPKLYKYPVRRIAAIVLACVLAAVLSACGGISDIPDPSTDYYVSDFAEVISAESTEYICTLSSALDGVSGAQIVIVTLPTLESYAIDRYASALFSGWGVGDGERNNGIMLVMCPSAAQYWMTIGDGLDSALGDGILRDMMAESLEPYFAAGDYDGGVRAIFDAIYDKLCKYYNVSPVPDSYDGGTYNGGQAYNKAVTGSKTTGRVFMILILCVVIVAAFVLMIRILLRGVLGIGDSKKKSAGRGRNTVPTGERTDRTAVAVRTDVPSRGKDARAAHGNVRQTPRAVSHGTQRSTSQNSRRESAAYDALRRSAQDGTSRGGKR